MEDPEWASLHYSSSNYATAGCSAASLAIALNAIEDGYYFTAEDIGNMVYGENSLGKRYVGADGIVDKAEFFEDQVPLENIGVTEVVQISKEDNYNPDEIEMLKRHLENGGVALILTDATTKFTKNRHYVAATDINEDGEIQIADPNYSNETREDKLKTRAVDNYTIGKGRGFDVNPEGFLNITLIFTEETGTFEELLDSVED